VSDSEGRKKITEGANRPTCPNPFEGSKRSSFGMRILLSACGVDEQRWVVAGDPDVTSGIGVVDSFVGELFAGSGAQIRGNDQDLLRIQVSVLLNQSRDLVRVKSLSGYDL
jgi:hypothetical protein